MNVIDLRSDTVTLPTEAMLDAMRRAELGDDSRDGDPTVRALEALAAKRVGKEAALFVPSGTMANLVALLTHAQRGVEVVLEQSSHIINSELGGIAALAGLFPRPIAGTRGATSPSDLSAALRKPGRANAGTGLVCMETTHNHAGGAVLPLDYMAQVYRMAREHGVPVHTDGARLFNAAVALRVDAARIAQYTDSVSFCISKGLSAPVGSLLAGSTTFIERARSFRRMVGGNMRQAGMLAAAGIVALETMVPRLEEDHGTARALAESLARIDRSLVDPATVETNIVRVDVRESGRDAAHWSRALKEGGVLVSPYGPFVLRFVTHRHVTLENVSDLRSIFGTLWQESSASRNDRGGIRE